VLVHVMFLYVMDVSNSHCFSHATHSLFSFKGWFDLGAKAYLHHESVAALSGEEDRTLSLSKCLEKFVEEEKIDEAYCSKCKEHRQGSLKTEFWRLPPVLVVKRGKHCSHLHIHTRMHV
jgi:uncharacterized UBP type Zn finger protein